MTIDLPSIGPSEIFGRGIFDGSKARDAAKGKVHPKIFREKDGREISVDRLSFNDEIKIAQSHDGERDGQIFHGWAVIDYPDACLMGRSVVPRPLCQKNKWHAEIILPPFVDDEKADQRAHSLNLANNAKWKAAPEPSAVAASP